MDPTLLHSPPHHTHFYSTSKSSIFQNKVFLKLYWFSKNGGMDWPRTPWICSWLDPTLLLLIQTLENFRPPPPKMSRDTPHLNATYRVIPLSYRSIGGRLGLLIRRMLKFFWWKLLFWWTISVFVISCVLYDIPKWREKKFA